MECLSLFIFFDPNGHRLELAANTGTPEQYQQLNNVGYQMVEEWSKTKRAPRHAAWLHEKKVNLLVFSNK